MRNKSLPVLKRHFSTGSEVTREIRPWRNTSGLKMSLFRSVDDVNFGTDVIRVKRYF